MSYNPESSTKVKHLKALAVRLKDELENSTPKKVSELENDSKYQTESDLSAAVSGLRTELMGEGVPEAYDTFKELADYIEEHKEVSDALTAAISDKVSKEEGKGLSSNDYTAEDKAKLGGIAEGATKVEASETDGAIKINGVDVQVVAVATDAEVAEMLNEVFSAGGEADA